jgi:hypothetical protein
MPRDYSNPILEGLIAGRADKERRRQVVRQEASDQRLIEQQKRDALIEDIKTRLALASNPALQQIGAGETMRTMDVPIAGAGGLQDPNTWLTAGQPSMPIQTPVETPIEYGGQRYAIRSEGEILSRRLSEAKAISDAEALAAGLKARKVFEATSVPSPQGLSERIGLAPGTPIPATTLDELLRATQEPKPAAEAAPHYETDDQGNVYRIGRTGEPQNIGRIGKSKTVPARTGNGGLTPAQDAAKTARDRRELAALEREEYGIGTTPGIHQKRLTEGKLLRAGVTVDVKTGKTRSLTDQERTTAAARLQVLNDRLRTIIRRKKDLGFITPEQEQQYLSDIDTGAQAVGAPEASSTANPYR